MIPQELEKLILRGKAEYSVYTHAMSAFGRIELPPGKLAVIVRVTWNHFFNLFTNAGTVSQKDAMKYNEYQLKIDSNKSKNYMTYRNGVFIDPAVSTSATNMTALTSTRPMPFVVQPPDTREVYFLCTDYIKITVTRNAYVATTASNVGLVSDAANEQPVPNGVKNMTVTRRLTMNTLQPLTMYLTPAGNAYAGLTNPGDRNSRSYAQDIDPVFSQIYPPDTGFNATLDLPYLTQPNIEFGVVLINTNEYNNMINS